MKKLTVVFFLGIMFLSFKGFCQAPSGDVVVGAYYFDGWTGRTNHITDKLKTFTEREPLGGWITSTPSGIIKQIDQAANAGISFFNFDWYYNDNASSTVGNDTKNNALKLYLAAPNKQKIKFSLLICTDKGISPNRWNSLVTYWLKLFKEPTCLKVNGKPLITFYNLNEVVKSFGGANNFKLALNKFRDQAKSNGLQGVSVAAVISPTRQFANVATQSGIDITTGYNDHGLGLNSIKQIIVPIKQMNATQDKLWSDRCSLTNLPLIPAVTLNWDKRPQDKAGQISKRFDGYSSGSVKEAIIQTRKWMNNNPNSLTKEKIVVLYAWNEYAEGAWLTPSQPLGTSLLDGLKAGLTAPIK